MPAHTRDYYARPDVAYLPIDDAPDLEWAFTWRRSTENRRIRAFNEAARDLVRRGGDTVRLGFTAEVASA